MGRRLGAGGLFGRGRWRVPHGGPPRSALAPQCLGVPFTGWPPYSLWTCPDELLLRQLLADGHEQVAGGRAAAVEDHLPRVGGAEAGSSTARGRGSAAPRRPAGRRRRHWRCGNRGPRPAETGRCRSSSRQRTAGRSSTAASKRLAVAVVGQAVADEDAAGQAHGQRAAGEELEIGVADPLPAAPYISLMPQRNSRLSILRDLQIGKSPSSASSWLLSRKWKPLGKLGLQPVPVFEQQVRHAAAASPGYSGPPWQTSCMIRCRRG